MQFPEASVLVGLKSVSGESSGFYSLKVKIVHCVVVYRLVRLAGRI